MFNADALKEYLASLVQDSAKNPKPPVAAKVDVEGSSISVEASGRIVVQRGNQRMVIYPWSEPVSKYQVWWQELCNDEIHIYKIDFDSQIDADRYIQIAEDNDRYGGEDFQFCDNLDEAIRVAREIAEDNNEFNPVDVLFRWPAGQDAPEDFEVPVCKDRNKEDDDDSEIS